MLAGAHCFGEWLGLNSFVFWDHNLNLIIFTYRSIYSHLPFACSAARRGALLPLSVDKRAERYLFKDFNI